MAAAREKTKVPGIYKRGGRYSYSYRVNGRLKWGSARTLDEARRAKAVSMADAARGEWEARSTIKLHEYAHEWVERYQGRGRQGFREGTRKHYRECLDNYALRFFPASTRLCDVTPSRIAEFIAWACKQTRPAPTKKQPKRRVPISDSTVRNALCPLRACLATAMREGIIRSNPALGSALPYRPADDGTAREVRAMSRRELSTLLGIVPERERLLFTFLAATGLRISEAAALRWKDLELDGSNPHVEVRRALVKGRMEPPKTRYGRRSVPLGHSLVLALRERRRGSDWHRDDDHVFASGAGSPIESHNLARRVLRPAAQEAGVPWVGFHAFRHTCASMLFAEGRNPAQVQHWLGHHSAAFTLATYVHLLDGDLGEPLSVPGVVTQVVTTPTPLDTDHESDSEARMAA